MILKISVPIPITSFELNPDTSFTEINVDTPVVIKLGIFLRSSTLFCTTEIL